MTLSGSLRTTIALLVTESSLEGSRGMAEPSKRYKQGHENQTSES
jgi:hypothetical protein